MTQLSVQVFDSMHGRPATGVLVNLERHDEYEWYPVVGGRTAEDGGLGELKGFDLDRGRYRLAVGSGGYFAALGSMTHFAGFTTDFQVAESEIDLRVLVYVGPATFSTYWHQE